MRALGFILAGLVMSLGLWTGEAKAQDEVVAEFAKTSTPPTIDGVGDDAVWESATAHTLEDFFTFGQELDGDDDLQVMWKALWDDTNLYLYVEVNDDELVYDESFTWEDDSIEFYIDAQNTDEPEYNPATIPEIPAYQFTVIAGQEPIDDTTSLFTWGINSYDGDDDITQYPQGADTGGMVMVEEEGFYSFEVAFPWEALEETPANIIERGEFGFGMAINDDDDGAGRDTQMVWAAEVDDLWHVASSFPSVALVGESDPGVVGDFNKDGELNQPDIDDLTGQSASGQNNPTYDLNDDNLVNDGDVRVWIKDLKNSWIGDANLDGEFSSGDLVVVLGSGTYETGVASVWSQGDFNGDGLTNTSDLVAALGDGGYELGPRAATASVPEPSALALLSLGMLVSLRRMRRR